MSGEPVQSHPPSAALDGESLRVLLVEDSPDHAELIARTFRGFPLGGQLRTCKTLSQARAAMREGGTDVVVADMRLPDGRGEDLLEDARGTVPLVLMTSFGDEEQAVRAIKAGAMDFVAKSPASFADLPKICHRAVREWRLRMEAEAAVAALATSEDRHRTLFENVPAGVFQCDPEGLITVANPAMAAMLGYRRREELEGLDLLRDIIAGGRATLSAVGELECKGRGQGLEVEMRRADGGAATMLMTAQAVHKGGHLYCYEGFCVDITDRISADRALAEARLRLEATFNNVFGFICVVDSEGYCIDVSESALRATGATREELKALRVWEMPWWRDIEGESEAARRGFEQAKSGEFVRDQTTFRTVDGSRRFADRSFTPVLEANGRLKFVIVEGRDVSELREALEQLRRSQDRYRNLFENASEALTVLDVERGVFLDANRSAERLFGASREALLGLGPMDLSPDNQPDGRSSRDLAERYLQAGMRGENPVFEWTHRTLGGREVPCEIRLVRVPGDEGVLIRGNITDISERKRAETRLRDSQKRMSALVENASAGILEIDKDASVVSANPAAVGMLGFNQAADLIGRHYLSLVSREDREAVAGALTGARSGHDASLSYKLGRRAGGRMLASSFTALRKDSDGDAVARVMILSDDVTERRRSEARLIAEKRFTEAVVNAMPGVFYVIDSERRLVRWNDNFARVTGLSHEQLGESPLHELIAKPDLQAVRDQFQRILEQGEGRVEARLVTAAGDAVPYLLNGLALNTEKGRFVVGMGFDISERRGYEAQLRASENYLRSVIESEPESVWTLDREGRVTDINPAGRLLLGEETLAAVRNSSILEIIAPEHRGAFNRMSASVFEGHSGILTFRIDTRDGRRRWLETHAVALRGEDGGIAGLLAVTRDVTDKRKADRKIRKYSDQLQQLSRRLLQIQELERHHLARELHDEVGQSLTALKLDLEAAVSELGHAGGRLADGLAIVQQVLGQVRDISLNLRPAILDDLGLHAALRWFLDRQGARAGFGVEFCADSLTGVRLDQDIETVGFRIVQEALTNTIRHAHATRARVDVFLDGQVLELVIADDGCGFDVADALRRSARGSSFGLTGIRERALLLGGSARIESEPGRGAKVSASLPVREWRHAPVAKGRAGGNRKGAAGSGPDKAP